MSDVLKQHIVDLIDERDGLILQVAQLRAEALAWHSLADRLSAQLKALQVDSTEPNPYRTVED